MIVVDSSIWVSWLVGSDIHHAASRRWLTQRLTSGEELVIPGHALAEVAGAIARRTGKSADGKRCVRQMLRIPALRLAVVDHALAMAASTIASELMLRGPDAIFVALAHDLGASLATWDREQATRAARLVPTLQPD